MLWSMGSQRVRHDLTTKQQQFIIKHFTSVSTFCVCFVEEVKRLNEKLTAANTAKVELQLQLDELQTSAFSVKVSVRKLSSNKNLERSYGLRSFMFLP